VSSGGRVVGWSSSDARSSWSPCPSAVPEAPVRGAGPSGACDGAPVRGRAGRRSNCKGIHVRAVASIPAQTTFTLTQTENQEAPATRSTSARAGWDVATHELRTNRIDSTRIDAQRFRCVTRRARANHMGETQQSEVIPIKVAHPTRRAHIPEVRGSSPCATTRRQLVVAGLTMAPRRHR
jgi:hypothetical protein